MNEFPPDHVIAERYKVVALLGAGGMGAVYLVEDISTNQKYALKTAQAEGNDRHFKRFELEAKATRMLQHPNLVQIFDYGFINNELPFFVMEYCQGENLADIIKSSGPLSVDKAIDVFITICNALTYAHSQQVVHRDMKPSNVMISDSEIKILDFGIAKVLRDETEFNTLTQTGELFGSPLYMSPEQCVGKAVDLRSDVYSLGCMLFEALTGTPPFAGETAISTMMKHQNQNPPTLKEATLGGEFPTDLEAIVASMLAKSPALRYQDLLHVADDLRRVQKGEPIEIGKSPERKSVSKGMIMIGIASIITLVIIAAYLLQPLALRTNMRVEVVPGKEVFLPHVKATSKTSGIPETLNELVKYSPSEHTRYYSTIKPGDPHHRDFQFPYKPIGDFGHGDNLYSYEVARGLHENVKIPLSVYVRFNPAGIAGFRNDEVCKLILKGYWVDDKATEMIKDWTELVDLDMDDTEISDISISRLKSLPKLTMLTVNDTNVTAESLRKLPLQSMCTLGLNRVKDARMLLPKLDNSQTLQYITFTDGHLTNDDMKYFGRMPRLYHIDIRRNDISDEGLRALTSLQGLQFLALTASKITPNCLDTLKKLHLQNLIFDECPWPVVEVKKFRNNLKRDNNSLKFDVKPVTKTGKAIRHARERW